MPYRAGNRVRHLQRLKTKSMSKKGKLIITEESKLTKEKRNAGEKNIWQ